MGARAQDVNMILALLQGRWVIAKSEQQGKTVSRYSGGLLVVTGDRFEIRTADGPLLKGTLSVDVRRRPWQMDLTPVGSKRWEAIWETEGDAIRLNYVEGGGADPRPTTFTTSNDTRACLLTLLRQ
jgi:uncharacterized protein (TIGR03067 family)